MFGRQHHRRCVRGRSNTIDFFDPAWFGGSKLMRDGPITTSTERETSLVFETHGVLSARGRLLVALHWFAGCSSRPEMRLPSARTLTTSTALFVYTPVSAASRTQRSRDSRYKEMVPCLRCVAPGAQTHARDSHPCQGGGRACRFERRNLQRSPTPEHLTRRASLKSVPASRLGSQHVLTTRAAL
jgi:hypothetical protein